MLAEVPDTYWIGFFILVAIVIAADLVIFRGEGHPRDPGVSGRKSSGGLGKSLIFFLLVVVVAAGFGVWLSHARGQEAGLEFASGYLIEISLSIDNLFVFLVVFRTFGLSWVEQREALFYGVLGAIAMRILFIFAGVALLDRFEWIEFVFGGFLLFTAVRLARQEEGPAPPGWAGRAMKRAGGRTRSKLLAAIVTIELVDLVFALDSIPAVLAVTNKTYVAYTSNIFAVLGLRSLYFLLAHILGRLRYLHLGLAGILVFVGIKMILRRWVHIPIVVSLGVILGLALIATAASLWLPESDRPEHSSQD